MIRDIWDIDNKTFTQDNIIQNRLIDRTNWRLKYTKIKNNVPKDWIEILKTHDTQITTTHKVSITSELKIHCDEKYIDPTKLKLKDIQSLLLDKTFKPKCQVKWETQFNQDFEWQSIWRSSTETPCSNKEKQFQWKLINNAIFTEHKLQLMDLSDGVCHLCRFEIEDTKHLFLTCPTTQAIIGVLENKMNEVLANHGFSNIELEGYHVILGFLHDNKTLRIFVNFIPHIFKWVGWLVVLGLTAL